MNKTKRKRKREERGRMREGLVVSLLEFQIHT
jgi:hypothetical protein